MFSYLTIWRVDYPGEDFAELHHVPVISRELVDVQALGVERGVGLRQPLVLQPVAVEDVAVPGLEAFEHVSSVNGGRLLAVLDEAVPLGFSCQ